MAYLQCTAGPHVNPHRNAGIYCHQWGDGIQRDWRLRLCAGHLQAFQDDLAKHELMPTDGAVGIIDTPTECFACCKPVDQGDWHFSVTAYPAKDQRKDYWSRLHINCRLPEWAQGGIELNSD